MSEYFFHPWIYSCDSVGKYLEYNKNQSIVNMFLCDKLMVEGRYIHGIFLFIRRNDFRQTTVKKLVFTFVSTKQDSNETLILRYIIYYMYSYGR